MSYESLQDRETELYADKNVMRIIIVLTYPHTFMCPTSKCFVTV